MLVLFYKQRKKGVRTSNDKINRSKTTNQISNQKYKNIVGKNRHLCKTALPIQGGSKVTIRRVLRNQRGMTLFEMLISIVVFVLAIIFIISLIANSLDKPKKAGILNDLHQYEQAATMMLSEVAKPENKTKDEIKDALNKVLPKQLRFDSQDKSLKLNPYSKNYTFTTTTETSEGETQLVLSVRTLGKEDTQEYQISVLKESGVTESCSRGFGKDNKKLITLVSSVCDEKEKEEPEEELDHKTEVPAGCIPIYTDEDLNNVRKNLTTCYILMANIDLTNSVHNNDADGWEPIGGTGASGFRGTFDGNNYTINGLKITKPSTKGLGLFKGTYYAKVSDVRLTNANIQGYGDLGVLVFNSSNTEFTNIYLNNIVVDGTDINDLSSSTNTGGLIGKSLTDTIITVKATNVSVTGRNYVGGLIGYSFYTNVSDVTMETTVKGAKSIGGLFGSFSTGEITSIKAKTDVQETGTPDTFANNIGGVSGVIASSNIDKITIETSIDTGVAGSGGFSGNALTMDVKGVDALVNTTSRDKQKANGGLIGSGDRVNVSDSTIRGSVNGLSSMFGGVVGYLMGESSVTNTSAHVNYNGVADNVGGLVGKSNDNLTLRLSYYNGSIVLDENSFKPTNYIGGLVGQLAKTGTLTDSYAVGSIKTTWSSVPTSVNLSGIIGDGGSGTTERLHTLVTIESDGGTKSGVVSRPYKLTAKDVYYLKVDGITSSRGVALTKEEMSSKSMFANWDFDTVWVLDSSVGYPTLR